MNLTVVGERGSENDLCIGNISFFNRYRNAALGDILVVSVADDSVPNGIFRSVLRHGYLLGPTSVVELILECAAFCGTCRDKTVRFAVIDEGRCFGCCFDDRIRFSDVEELLLLFKTVVALGCYRDLCAVLGVYVVRICNFKVLALD